MANNSSPASPVSPLQAIPYFSLPATQNNNGASTGSNTNVTQPPIQTVNTQSVPQPKVPSPVAARQDWIPFTFQWYFLLLPTLASLGFSIALAYLCWYSGKNFGLGNDDGSSAILFGWRFTPTLIAVLYTQTVVILFEDLKRTEPFARLAKPPLGGANAHGTVLQKPKAWWAILIDLTFKRKHVGRSSWALVCSAIIYTIALLAISPLSSALLASEELAVPRTLDFNKLAPISGKQLPLEPTRDVYFRTIAALTRDLPTSAWTSDTSLNLPFWPSSGKLQLTPELASAHSSWEAETKALSLDFTCQNMTLEKAEVQTQKWRAKAATGPQFIRNGTTPMVSFVLTTPDKCKYEFDLHPAVEIAYRGGVIWSNVTSYQVLRGDQDILNLEKEMFSPNVSFESPWARQRASKECGDREIIIISTPWTSPIEKYTNEPFWGNETYTKSPNFRMRALLCESGLSDTVGTTTALMSPGKPTIMQHKLANKQSSQLVNYTQFQQIALEAYQWERYVDFTALRQDDPPPEAEPIVSPWSSDGDMVRKQLPQYPKFLGMARLLGPLLSWNVSSIIDDQRMPDMAARIKGRFLMEIMQKSLSNPQLMQVDALKGTAIAVETRVVVLREVGIALSVLFGVSFCLLLGVLWFSRLSRRPLNLLTDPGSTVGMAMLLDRRRTSMNALRKLHRAPTSDILTNLRSTTFLSTRSTLHEGSSKSASNSAAKPKKKKNGNWRPRVLHMRYLFALGLFLALITVALLVLVTFSSRSQLYQKAFVYQADLSKFGLSISTFAPISIAPTIISIIISLWWDQIDLTFRLLQPYIAMSRSPTPVSSSSGITYRSKTWIGAVIKAARHRHWILCFVAIGTTLSQVLTVSMSALFERKPHNVLSRVNLNRTLETRQMPVITTIDQTGWPFEWDDVYAATKLDKTVRWDITEPLYQNSSYNWLYNTPTKFSVNAPQMTWTQGAWSFAPVDLSSIIVPDSRSTTEKEVRKAAVVPFMNVTLRTSAIRARLDCEPIDEVADKSTWLQAMSVQLLNETLINTTMEYITLPEGLSDGYILIEKMFANTSSVTTIRRGGDEKMTKCCINGTGQSPQRAAIGYWTPVQTEGWNRTDPYPSQGKLQWPPSIVTKWIVGKPQSFKDQGNITVGPLFFEEQPVLQAARCKPIIETAEAKILIDRTTSTVHSHELLGPITGLDSAWYENHVRHDLSDPEKQYNMNYTGKLNTTTSLGILFLDGLLSASVSKEPVGDVYYAYENTGTDQFVYREEDGGLNMDLMSYTMYTLANNDPEALLNYTTLVNNANRTFQSFFQDFVNTKLAHYNDDGTGFQRIGANMKDLGQAVDYNGASLVNPLYPSLNTDRTIEAVISSRRQVLYMNPVATYLAVAIITWLIATTAVVAALQRRYTSTMLRNVELIADVLVLIAGSENFLDLVQERGPALKKDGNVKTQLGWFKGRDGEVRWGVEVVGGRNPVEWVDAPMKRFT